jgi:hypothetical protein
LAKDWDTDGGEAEILGQIPSDIEIKDHQNFLKTKT